MQQIPCTWGISWAHRTPKAIRLLRLVRNQQTKLNHAAKKRDFLVTWHFYIHFFSSNPQFSDFNRNFPWKITISRAWNHQKTAHFCGFRFASRSWPAGGWPGGSPDYWGGSTGRIPRVSYIGWLWFVFWSLHPQPRKWWLNGIFWSLQGGF